MLEFLFHLAAEHRLLFINVFRPGYEKTGERIVKTIQDQCRDWYTELSLKALDGNQAETLVKNLLEIEGLPANIQRKIIDRSGGNPFFVEEIVRSFIDKGVVTRERGRFQVTEKIQTAIESVFEGREHEFYGMLAYHYSRGNT